MTHLTPEELAAIRQRADKATPGPWVDSKMPTNEARVYPAEPFDVTEFPKSPYRDVGIWPVGIDAICTMQVSNNPKWRDDKVFIAAARSDIPRLLAHIAALTDVVRDLTAGPGAGLGDDDEWYCIYCLRRRPRPPDHAPDCPIVRGREMVKEDI